MSAINTAVLSDLAGFSIEDKTPEQILAAMVKKSKQVTEHSISLSAMAYVLIIDRSYSLKETADKLEMSNTAVSMYAKRGRVLAMSADKVTALKIWNQIVVLTDKELDELGAQLVTTQEPAEMVQNVTMRKLVTSRLGTNTSPEAVDKLMKGLTESGNTQPKAVRSALPDMATALGIPLPKVTREPQTQDQNANKVPTTSGALATLQKFEADREEGSEGADVEFALTDEETADLVKSAQTIIRTLRQANRFEAIAEVGIFLEESIELATA
jgi:hypothetical protein